MQRHGHNPTRLPDLAGVARFLIRTCEIQTYEPCFIKSITDGDASKADRPAGITKPAMVSILSG